MLMKGRRRKPQKRTHLGIAQSKATIYFFFVLRDIEINEISKVEKQFSKWTWKKFITIGTKTLPSFGA